VIVEFDLLGTNLGEFYGLPPTGKAFRVSAHRGVSSSKMIGSSTSASISTTASLVTQIGRAETARPGRDPRWLSPAFPDAGGSAASKPKRRLVRATAELVGEIGPTRVTLANVGQRRGI